MARIRNRKALEKRLERLEQKVTQALERQAPKPQDRDSAAALIRQQLRDRLDAFIRGEKPPKPPAGHEAAEELLYGGEAAIDVAKVRAELTAEFERRAECRAAERQQVVRDLEGWAAQLNALAEQIVVPHAPQEPVYAVDDAKVTPIAEAPSRRAEEANFIGFGESEPDEHWQPSLWRVE